MDQEWIDQLIADAELVADAAIRLTKAPVDKLLQCMSDARNAADNVSRDRSYRALQLALSPILQALDPITMSELQESWIMHRGFRRKRAPAIGFWLFSVMLLVLVGYMTSLHDRAANIALSVTELQSEHLFEKGVTLYYLARDHTDEIISAQAGGKETLAAETFFRTLSELQDAQARASNVLRSTNDLWPELQSWSRGWYTFCSVFDSVASLVGGTLHCVDPTVSAPPALQAQANDAPYSNVPPPDLARILADAKRKAGAGPQSDLEVLRSFINRVDIFPRGPNSTGAGQQGALPTVGTFLDGADAFFTNVGLDQISTRSSISTRSTFHLPGIQSALAALRLWFLPAAYGSLGAAIFFTRRFLNPAWPNPDSFRVIYRILFGGFAGILFAWFWSPLQAAGGGVPLISFSSFGVAFLAGYSTDILFSLLDRMVESANQQLRKSPVLQVHRAETRI
jgi:hypothetical protein